MRKKLDLFLVVLMICAAFLFNGCGENDGSVPSTPVTALADDERQIMYSVMYSSLLALEAYNIDNGVFPSQKEALEDYGIKYGTEYEVRYKANEKNGKIEDFSFKILNPAKTHELNFDSICYKDSSCLATWKNQYQNEQLDDSQIKPVAE